MPAAPHSESEKLKQLGNLAWAQGRLEEAVEHFTNAIKIDPENHVLYSNRAAANTALGKADRDALQLAVDDAKKCVELKPDFAKGYSRQVSSLKSSQVNANSMHRAQVDSPHGRNALSTSASIRQALRRPCCYSRQLTIESWDFLH